MIQEQLKKAKTARTLFIVFQILGIILIALPQVLIFKPTFEYFSTLFDIVINAPSNFETLIINAMKEYLSEALVISLLQYVGIAMTIVFSILRGKKGSKIKELQAQLLAEQEVAVVEAE